MKQKKHIGMLILVTTLIAVLFTLPSHAEHLTKIESIANLNFLKGSVQFTAPYSILEDTTFTADLNTYRFKNYEIKIINAENPLQINFEAVKKNPNEVSPEIDFDIEKQLPWWLKSAPIILKNLDFTKVDGQSDSYDMGNGYRLTLLSNQGNWGKVYLLERLGDDIKKICAVKLILTRSDREMAISDFHERHKEELQNNRIASDFKIAVKPYGIIKKDADHYLLLMEYGENALQYLKLNGINLALEPLYQFLKELNNMHLAGFAHGDLKLENVLLIDNQFKLCDWYSLTNINKKNVGKYRYYGDQLPPEALRALYFKKEENLNYSLVNDQSQNQFYFLHPITADRFCLAVSLMEAVAPDLYKAFYSTFPKGFKFYNPDSLQFWPKFVEQLRKIQVELLHRSKKIQDKRERQLYEQISQYLDVNPMNRDWKKTNDY